VIDLDDVFVLHAGVDHDVAALRGLSLQVSAGERVVVWGPSGSGKSTVVGVVTAHARPSAGRARLFGLDVGQIDERGARSLRRRMGLVGQRSAHDLLPELSVVGNVALQARVGGAGRGDAVRRAHAQIAEFGLEHLAHRDPRSLSGGELQRIALAAALVNRPQLIVADEPTGELDAVNAGLVYDQLERYCDEHGAALLLVSHDHAAERIAHRVLTINDGRLSHERVDGADALVVDRRGWVRLPEDARRVAGVGGRVAASAVAGGIRLDPTGAPSVEATVASVPAAAPGTSVPIVVLRDVSLDLGAGTVLGPVSAELHAGHLVAVVGRSGSGKTSLLTALLGGRPLLSGSIDRGADAVVGGGVDSCCPQAPGFAETSTVRDNVDLGRAMRGQVRDDTSAARMETMLRHLGLTGLADRPVATLSGGERQRVAVARALLTDSDLVIVDEPTSQLDRTTAQRVVAVLRGAARSGRCIVCATHDPDLVELADQQVVLS
jgi:ABC-type lipoprotein export system ATPase subunit